MKYKVIPTNKFKKEYKLALKRGKKIEKLHEVVELLVKDLDLPASLCDHELKGNWKITGNYIQKVIDFLSIKKLKIFLFWN